jgi:hypothetical protein
MLESNNIISVKIIQSDDKVIEKKFQSNLGDETIKHEDRGFHSSNSVCLLEFCILKKNEFFCLKGKVLISIIKIQKENTENWIYV